jgi:hypothetical protein
MDINIKNLLKKVLCISICILILALAIGCQQEKVMNELDEGYIPDITKEGISYVNQDLKNGFIYEGEDSLEKNQYSGKLMNKDGKVIYEGEFINGIPNGNGILHMTNKSVYEGQFKNGFADGFGKISLKDGSNYYGFWVKGDFIDGNYNLFNGKDDMRIEGCFSGNFIYLKSMNYHNLLENIRDDCVLESEDKYYFKLNEESRSKIEAYKDLSLLDKTSNSFEKVKDAELKKFIKILCLSGRTGLHALSKNDYGSYISNYYENRVVYAYNQNKTKIEGINNKDLFITNSNISSNDIEAVVNIKDIDNLCMYLFNKSLSQNMLQEAKEDNRISEEKGIFTFFSPDVGGGADEYLVLKELKEVQKDKEYKVIFDGYSFLWGSVEILGLSQDEISVTIKKNNNKYYIENVKIGDLVKVEKLLDFEASVFVNRVVA